MALTDAEKAALAQENPYGESDSYFDRMLKPIREDAANIASDFRGRQQNVNELMRKRLETKERKQLATLKQ